MVVLGVALAAVAGAGSSEAPEDKTLSPYFAVKSDDPATDRLPLLSTTATVDIAGVIADVHVTQVYKNDGKRAIEAIYTFPASTRAAVYAMKMTIGDRTIVARIKERAQARQDYEDAKAQGKTASLLEQERPNVFQMNVANIMPGDYIRVEMSYTELLVPEAGVYEFAYPTVVGPRYNNKTAAESPDNDKWVASPYTHSGDAPSYTFGMTAHIEAGLPIQEISCPSHKTDTRYHDPTNATIMLDPSEKQGGNRDFILRYRLAGGQIASGLLLFDSGVDAKPGILSKRTDAESFFLLMLQPPKRVDKDQIPPREYIFILDVSGSMYGFPLDITKTLMRNLFVNLRPTDYFNVLLFAGGNAVLAEKSLRATQENLADAIDMIEKQQGGGGTELLPALQRALALPHTEGTSRTVVIATDGYVSVETEAFDLIRDNLGNANFFAFGIGSSVNRFIIEGMAHVGMGEPFVIENPEAAAAQAEKFRKYIQSPVLTGIRVQFNGLDAYDVEPKTVPDVMAERPIIVFGKYHGKATGTITVTGHSASGAYRKVINVAQTKPDDANAALRYLWARHRIQTLADYNNITEDSGRIKEVTQLGLQYNLLTQYTSFIAVDQQIRNRDGKPEVVEQPLPMPSGVSDYAIGGGASTGAVGRGFMGGAKMSAAMPSVSAEMTLQDKDDITTAQPPPALTVTVQVGKLTVSGNLTQKTVKDVITRKLEDLRLAYANEVAVTPGLRGQLTLEFTIGTDGKATGFASDKNELNAALEQAVVEILKKLQFPKPAVPVTVSLPLTFKP